MDDVYMERVLVERYGANDMRRIRMRLRATGRQVTPD
jgi:hypothetical protein